ncbi:MAG: signal peptidase I [Lactobacillaceae bacterium]|jgi:signal peptidase|nr:signal peptidase I [Lactobacillaceae bacterium]
MKKFKQILGWVVTIILCTVLGLNIATIAVREIGGQQFPMFAGYGQAVVVSGSMEPNIKIHDLVVVHAQNKYQKGDVITFEGSRNPTTHRIVKVTKTGYETKGDANNVSDGIIERPRVYGKVIMNIPYVGCVQEFLRTPLGMVTIIGLMVLVWEAPNLKTGMHRFFKKEEQK